MCHPSRALFSPAASWSSTLRLPKSSFPARATAAGTNRYLPRCTDDLYAWQRRERPARNTFTLHDGPPYANGSLHIGHALNKILKDMVCRVQLTQGKRINYVPGWDCHGLPIELKALERPGRVEQKGAKAARDQDPMTVRDAARELATSAVEQQKQSFKGWGIMADWDGAWKTMDKDFEMKQLDVFRGMVQKGLIYRRFKPVYWSGSSSTALAEAELEYRDDHPSQSAFIRFPLVKVPASLGETLGVHASELGALIWTTTPWTLPANRAIAVHSDLNYAVVTTADHGQLLVAQSRLDHCKEHFDLEVVADNIRGSDLIGEVEYRNVLCGAEAPSMPFLHADFVSADAGTGLVHCAPGHGMDDYDLCRRHGIAAFGPVDDHGCFTRLALPDDPEVLAGLSVMGPGTDRVLAYLHDFRHVVARFQYRHKYPYDWRTKRPVIIRATEQWFANVGNIKEAALNSLEDVQFTPSSGKARLRSFVKGRSEWCISRQRAWGVPIPALYHRETGEAILSETSVAHIMSVIRERGTDAWWTDPEFDPSWVAPDLVDATETSMYRRGRDTMDVWFDSGTSWTQMAGHRSSETPAPADVYLEGTDQHRGWFQSSLLTHVAHQDPAATSIAPFRELITHGFTLDSKGRKMSKSIGNVISPDMIMTGSQGPSKKGPATGKNAPYQHSQGPDALRLWVAGSDYTKDISVGPQVLQTVTTTLHKLRVTIKLLLGALDDFDPAQLVKYDDLTRVDQMALLHLYAVTKTTRDAYLRHDFAKAVGAIHNWVKVDLSALYVEVIKDRLYLDKVDSLSRRSVQTVMLHVFNHLLGMLAPVTPLLVEEAWDYAPEALKQNATHPLRRVYPTAPESWSNEPFAADLPLLLASKEAVNAAQEQARGAKQIGSSLESAVVLRLPASSPDAYALFRTYESELEALFVVSDVTLVLEGDTDSSSKPLTTSAFSSTFEVGNGAKATVHVSAIEQTVPGKAKCGRCWRYAAPADVEADKALCERCAKVCMDLTHETKD